MGTIFTLRHVKIDVFTFRLPGGNSISNGFLPYPIDFKESTL